MGIESDISRLLGTGKAKVQIIKAGPQCSSSRVDSTGQRLLFKTNCQILIDLAQLHSVL
jgi:hypothetical protein